MKDVTNLLEFSHVPLSNNTLIIPLAAVMFTLVCIIAKKIKVSDE